MAIIECKNCGKNVSDKAKICPHCETILISDIENKFLCKECRSELFIGEKVCHNCGCPVEQISCEEAQKVEVTSVNIKLKKSTKKFFVIGLIVLLLAFFSVFVTTVVLKIRQKNRVEEYKTNVAIISVVMLDGAADAEEAGNLIKSVWYNSIYEEYDYQTDKYTLENGKFVDDFNDALGNLFSDESFEELIVDIENNQNDVAKTMKELKDPPEECEEMYESLKEYYDAYLMLTNLAIDPTGSLTSFSSSFNDADSEVLNCYNALKIYIDDVF